LRYQVYDNYSRCHDLLLSWFHLNGRHSRNSWKSKTVSGQRPPGLFQNSILSDKNITTDASTKVYVKPIRKGGNLLRYLARKCWLSGPCANNCVNNQSVEQMSYFQRKTVTFQKNIIKY